MNTRDFFLLQLTSQKDIDVARSLEMGLRCLRGKNGLDAAISSMIRDFPNRAEQYNSGWFLSLIDAIKPFYKPIEDTTDDSYDNPLNAFLESIMCKLNASSFAIIGNLKPDLNNIDSGELVKPHMQWVKCFTDRFNQLQSDFPEHKRKWVRMARIHPSLGVDDNMLLELNTVYFEDYIECMTFPEYVDYYVNSRDKFFVEGETLKPNVESEIKSVLKSWLSDDVTTVESCVDGILRSFEFHENHQDFLKGFIVDFKKELGK